MARSRGGARRSACGARTAPARCWPPVTSYPVCWAASPPCSRSSRGTKRRWRRRSAVWPTRSRWPASTTSRPRSPAQDAGRRPGRRCSSASPDHAPARPRPRRRHCPTGARWALGRGPCDRRAPARVDRALPKSSSCGDLDAARDLVRAASGTARGDAGRRCARRLRRGRRFGQGAELHRGTGGGRRGPAAPDPRRSPELATLRAQLAGARAEVAAPRGSRRRRRRRRDGKRTARATRRRASSPSWVPPPDRPGPRRTGWPQRVRRPRRLARRAWPG